MLPNQGFIALCSDVLLRQRTGHSNPKNLLGAYLCLGVCAYVLHVKVGVCMWEWVWKSESECLYVYVCVCVCVCIKKVILSMFNGTLCTRNDFHCKGGFYRTGPFKYFDIPQVVVGPSCYERELTILKKWENVFIAFPHLLHRYRGCWLTLLGQVPMLRSRVRWVSFFDAVMMI